MKHSCINKGFTLIELLIVVAIMGILSAVAVPTYVGYVENSRASVAKNNLRNIYLQQQQYYEENNAYYSTGASCTNSATAINTNLFAGKTILTDDYFNYCILQSDSDHFIAHADQQSGSDDFTINQDNTANFSN